MTKQNLTTDELAKELSINRQYVRDLARMGLIPAKKIGTSWRFDLAAVEKQMEENAARAVERAVSGRTRRK